jgi:hypothetical protein
VPKFDYSHNAVHRISLQGNNMSLANSFASFRDYVFGIAPCASAIAPLALVTPLVDVESDEDLSEVYALLERFRAQQSWAAQKLATTTAACAELALHD